MISDSDWNNGNLKDYCAIVPFYQDRDVGHDLLAYLNDLHCPSIWGDGPFMEFQKLHGGEEKSTDGLRDLIKGSKNVTLIDCGVCYVQDKWNKLLQKAHEMGFKYAFLFGCDEIPKGDFEECVNNIKKINPDKPTVYRIWMDEKGNNDGEQFQDHSGPKERVFFRPGDIEVRELHWAFFDKTVRDSYPLVSDKTAVKGLTFTHDNTRRPKDRDRQMQEYQKKRVPHEYKKSRDVIFDVHDKNHLTMDILIERYPGCNIKEQKRYDGSQCFQVEGCSEDRLDDFMSYVKFPFNDNSGLYITKGKIAIQLER